MDPLRVFVSSTTLDLADYRKAVKDRLDQMGVSVEVMENFLARRAE